MIIPKTLFTQWPKARTFVVLLCFVFILIRLPGVHVPYYQDEWKNVSALDTVESAGEFYTHPPLFQILFRIGYIVFGADNFRLFPLTFSLVSFILLYLVLKNRIDRATALWGTAFFSICFYGILGSLMPDVDGAFVPVFFLVSVYAYDRWREAVGTDKCIWFACLFVALLIGFLIKLNFILVVGALIVDFFWEHRKNITLQTCVRVTSILVFFAVIYTVLLYSIAFVYPAFDISRMFGHASKFAENSGRNWIQIIVQAVKAIFYLSPLLIVPLVFTSKDIFRKTRIFWLYLILGFIFYFIAFDFSRGALDKYLMFTIVPLVVIVGCIFAEIYTHMISRKYLWWGVFMGVILSVILITLNFLPHEVLPLYPKTLWFSRVLKGQWMMLNPFNGGSGPMGFYVSFLFIGMTFFISFVGGVIAFFIKKWRTSILVALVIVSCTYNAVLVEELFYGKINGSAAVILRDSIEFIAHTSSINQIITFNDIGTRELAALNKHGGRFYAAPQFEEVHKKKFAEYKGDYLVIGIPPLYDGFYSDFFTKCDILFHTRSGSIDGDVYRCNK